MKNYLFLSFLVSLGNVALAQETLTQSLNRVSVQAAGNKPLFIVKLEEKSFETRSSEGISSEDILKEIDPTWIESIEVFKDEKAKEKFGDKGHAGVILIALKQESAEKMSNAFSKRFE